MAAREHKHVFTGESKKLEDAADKSAKALGKVDDAGEKAGKTGKWAEDQMAKLSGILSGKLGPAGGVAEGALSKLTASAGGASGALGLGVVGAAGAAAVAIGSFVAGGVGKFVELADEVRDFARASGASAEEASRFVAVADDMGIASDALSGAMFKLGKTAGTNSDFLSKYGVEVARNAEGSIDLTETTLNIADAFSTTKDPAKRAELAMAAFGKRGQELIPILEQGRKGLEEFFEGAEGNRQILSQEDLDRARELELGMDALGDAVDGLQRGLGSELVPVLADVANGAAKVITAADDLTERVGGLGGVAKTFVNVLSPATSLLGFLGDSSDDAAEAQLEHEDAARAVAEALDAERLSTDQQIKALDNLLLATQAQFSSQIAYERSLNSLEDATSKVAEATTKQTEAVKAHGPNSTQAKTAAEELTRAQLSEKEAALQVAAAAVRQAEDQAKANGATLSGVEKNELYAKKLGEVRDTLAPGSPLRAALEGYIATLERAPDKLTTAIAADVSEAERTIRAFRERVKAETLRLNLSAGTMGGGGPGLTRGHAHGGHMAAGEIGIVGEEGPEVFIPDTAGTIVPNSVTVGTGRKGALAAAGAPAAPGTTTTNLNFVIQMQGTSKMEPRELATRFAEALRDHRHIILGALRTEMLELSGQGEVFLFDRGIKRRGGGCI